MLIFQKIKTNQQSYAIMNRAYKKNINVFRPLKNASKPSNKSEFMARKERKLLNNGFGVIPFESSQLEG